MKYLEYINQHKIFTYDIIKNMHENYNKNNTENRLQPKVLDTIIKYTENLIISPKDISNSSLYSANSIDVNDFNLENSYSYEGLIEGNEFKKNKL